MKTRITIKMLAVVVILGILSGCHSSICNQTGQEPKDRVAELYDLDKDSFVKEVVLKGEMNGHRYRYSRSVGYFWTLTLRTLTSENSFAIWDDNDSDDVGDNVHDECTLYTKDSEKTYNEGPMLKEANKMADKWIPDILEKHGIEVRYKE